MKFTIYNYSGEPKSYYKVEKETLPTTTTTVVGQSTAHLILVIDRSGSMRSSMNEVKRSIEEVLTAEAVKEKSLLVSLISYSSVGDATVHFTRSPIAQLASGNSAELQAIRSLSPTGLTCLSGGLDAALKIVDANETTMISLHSDGCANDDSSYGEQQRLARLLQSASNPNLSVHTIAHSSWSDFQALSRIANVLSGTCVYARASTDVEAPLRSVVNDACGPVEPPFVVAKGDADFLIFYSKSGRRILAGEVDVMVSGVPEGADRTAYRYTEISKKEYDQLNVQVCGEQGAANAEPLYLFSRGLLSLGRLNLSKYALISTRDNALIQNHYRALVNEDLAEMAIDIEQVVFNDGFANRAFQSGFGFDSMETSVIEITSVLQRYASAFQVDISKLRSVYTRRTLKKVLGSRDEAGRLIPPNYETRPVEADDFVEVVECEINQNTASINLTVSDPVQLYPVGKDTAITEISGVDVSSLKAFRAFTIVGDGQLNLPEIHLKIGSAAAFQALKKLRVVSGEHAVDKSYRVDLRSRPMLPFKQEFGLLGGVFGKLMSYRVLQSVLRALLKGSSTKLTGAQVQELRAHHITPNLNINLPVTVPYDSLDAAISNGDIERRASYIIDIGTVEIQNKADFRSANQCLKTFYTFAADSAKPGKDPKWEHLKDANVSLVRKSLSARTKTTTADTFMLEIFDSLLGISSTKAVDDIFKGMGKSALAIHTKAFSERKTSQEVLAGLEEIEDALTAVTDEEYAHTVSPIVFYIGSTGVLPDDYDYRAFDAEALQKMYPHLRIQKTESVGTFFVFDDNIISVFVEDVLVSR